MGFRQFFDRRQVEDYGSAGPRKSVEFPAGYREEVNWVPRIGDLFPNFSADTTHGPITFHDWAEGQWVVLFSHPSIVSPVSASEYAALASNYAEFQARNTAILGMSSDRAVDHARWEVEVANMFGFEIPFPTVEDTEGHLSRDFGIVRPRDGQDLTIRKTFIIDPSLRVAMIHKYPINVGRSVDEILRCLDALQVVKEHRVGTPADWDKGQPALLAPYLNDSIAQAAYGQIHKLSPSIRLVNCPTTASSTEMMPETPLRARREKLEI